MIPIFPLHNIYIVFLTLRFKMYNNIIFNYNGFSNIQKIFLSDKQVFEISLLYKKFQIQTYVKQSFCSYI